MTDESTSVRDALSACGLFAAAEVEELAAEAGREGRSGSAAPASKGAAPASNGAAPASNGNASGGSILDELDRVLPPDGAVTSRESRPAPPAPRRAPEPASQARGPEPSASGRSAPAAPHGALDDLLEKAMALGARALHLDAEDDVLRARARVGSERVEVGTMRAADFTRRLRESLKAEGSAPIAATAEMPAEIGGRMRSLSVATLATPRGVRYTLSGIDRPTSSSLDALGLEPEPLDELRAALERKSGGLVLIGAARGNDASATIRAAASESAKTGRFVLSLEERADSSSEIVSVRVEPGLRGRVEAMAQAVRNDPDVVAAGRISTLDEAFAVLQAAAGGRLVLASIAARDAADAASSLRTLGIDPFLLAAAQPCLVGQRVARALCTSCREREKESAATEQLRAFGFEEGEVDAASLYRAVGCPRCRAGYRDRFLLMEAVPADRMIFEALRGGAHGDTLAARLPKDRVTLRGCAIRAVARGRTTIDEAARAIAS